MPRVQVHRRGGGPARQVTIQAQPLATRRPSRAPLGLGPPSAQFIQQTVGAWLTFLCARWVEADPPPGVLFFRSHRMISLGGGDGGAHMQPGLLEGLGTVFASAHTLSLPTRL